MKFSLLMSIYHKEDPAYFDRCMHSVWEEQSVRPDEIVLVQDGPLTNPLYRMITQWKERLGEALVIVALEKNVGLGEALNTGLLRCRHDLVARMDTDDIALEDRFARQLTCFETQKIDICSAWVGEFSGDESQIVSYRRVPRTHSEIITFAKKRNPINHPAVMYKKSKILEAGGYKTMTGFEDYYLWVRMILSHALFYNIQEPLVNMRAGEAQLKRRRGFAYAGHEFAFQKKLLSLGFITRMEFLKNITIRFTARVVPPALTRSIYTHLRH